LDAYIRCGHPEKSVQMFFYISDNFLDESLRFDEHLAKHRMFNSDSLSNFEKKIYSMFRNSGLIANVRTYNTILKALRALGPGTYNVCIKIMDRMGDLGISPDSITVNTVIDACVQMGDLHTAHLVSFFSNNPSYEVIKVLYLYILFLINCRIICIYLCVIYVCTYIYIIFVYLCVQHEDYE